MPFDQMLGNPNNPENIAPATLRRVIRSALATQVLGGANDGRSLAATRRYIDSLDLSDKHLRHLVVLADSTVRGYQWPIDQDRSDNSLARWLGCTKGQAK